MKNLLVITLITFAAISCGKNNKVNTGPAAVVVVNNFETPSKSIENFAGTYDLIKMKSDDCGASIELVKECEGLILFSNHLGPEEFCHINQLDNRNNNNRENNRNTNWENNRNDNRFDDHTMDPRFENSNAVVTLIGNELKSVITVSADNRNDRHRNENQVIYTNTLTLNSDGTLSKISNFKSRESRCLYLKR